jgi:ribosomal protein L37AE/L43A
MAKKVTAVVAITSIRIACPICESAIFGPRSRSHLWSQDDCIVAVANGDIACAECRNFLKVPAMVVRVANGG